MKEWREGCGFQIGTVRAKTSRAYIQAHDGFRGPVAKSLIARKCCIILTLTVPLRYGMW